MQSLKVHQGMPARYSGVETAMGLERWSAQHVTARESLEINEASKNTQALDDACWFCVNVYCVLCTVYSSTGPSVYVIARDVLARNGAAS